MSVKTRVAPDTELAGYPANGYPGKFFARYRISGTKSSAIYICIISLHIVKGCYKIFLIPIIFKVFRFFLRILIFDFDIQQVKLDIRLDTGYQKRPDIRCNPTENRDNIVLLQSTVQCHSSFLILQRKL